MSEANDVPNIHMSGLQAAQEPGFVDRMARKLREAEKQLEDMRRERRELEADNEALRRRVVQAETPKPASADDSEMRFKLAHMQSERDAWREAHEQVTRILADR